MPFLFSFVDVLDTIKSSSHSTATAPDGLTPEHFKHLGQTAINYLTDLFNLSVGGVDIPVIWKKALVIPIAKPGKPATVSTSFRPISLLCPAAKILEKLLLPFVTESLVPADYQHGFRPMRYIMTALLPITNMIVTMWSTYSPTLSSIP
jgi:hypothetical protein